MSGGAPGDLVARAFESMLKECSNKKYNALQSSIQTYLGAFLSRNSVSFSQHFGPLWDKYVRVFLVWFLPHLIEFGE